MPDFDFSSLITDRSQADVDNLQSLLSTPLSDWTAEQLAAFNQAISKGAYNYTDLNRVTACMDYLAGVFQSLGYQVPGYKKVEIPRSTSRLPDGYTELEYIESSGTQYIDTGIPVNSNLGVVCECDLAPKISPAWLFGSREGAHVNTFNFVTVNGEYRSDYGNENVGTPFSISAGTRFSLSKIGPVTKVDGVVMDTESTQTFASTTPLYIFANNNNGEVQGRCTAKLFYLQMLEGGKLLRDFIPCVGPDGSVGLYDAVEGEFYGNAGSGTFTAGPEVSPPTPVPEPMDPYTWYESDIPTASTMAAYLSNVAALRGVLAVWADTPEVPDDMEGLTYEEANDIERILLAVDALITNMINAYFYSNEIVCGEV